MTGMAGEYKLECYQKIMPLGTKGNLWLVEDSVTKNRFVMRKLLMDSQQVYQELAAVHHANIVEITDIFLHNGFCYVIEEYLEWELLSDVMEMKKFSKRQALSIGRQLFHALLVLHGQRIVHRDIKPENIMIDADGTVKLIDFDIARLFAEDKSGDTSIKGTKDYAPPEQFGFAQSDGRADIYSVGVTLNELAVGKLPEEKLCSGALGAVIKRCIEFDPKRRYQNAAQALKHMDLLEKRAALFFLPAAAAVLLSVLITAKAFVFPKENSFETAKNQDKMIDDFETAKNQDKMIDDFEAAKNQDKMIDDFEAAEYQDRMIDVQDADRYPAVLMTENQEYQFSADLGHGMTVNVSADKADERLLLTCVLADGSVTDFEFHDVFSDVYKQQGYSNHIDFERTSPEYEILLDDLDEDGIMDLLVSLAWRCRIDTPDAADRYYFTEYSALWVVYMTKDNKPACSKPLYFNGCTPELWTDTLIYDYECQEWYTFKNGTWH